MRKRDIEDPLHELGERAGERAQHFANGAAERTRHLYELSRELGTRLGRRGDGYGRRLARAAEDLADQANYRYRRLRRGVSRHPVATAAVVAGAIGAFLLLRQALRDDDE